MGWKDDLCETLMPSVSEFLIAALWSRRLKMRIALISSRFWPISDPVARHAGEFAAAASQLGVECTVFTACHDAERTVPYYRQGFCVWPLKPTQRRGRQEWKFARKVAAAIQPPAGDFDAIYVLGVDHVAACLVAKLRKKKTRVIIRSTRVGPHGDAKWPHQGMCRSWLRSIISQAGLILASSETGQQEWRKSGVEASRVMRIPYGFRIDQAAKMSQQQARDLLAETHPLFHLPADARLCLLMGDLTEPRKLRKLPEMWSLLRTRFPDAYLWMVGEGPASEKIWQAIGRYDLAQFVLLPGQFDDPTPLLDAADIYLEPGRVLENELPMLAAIAHQKRILASRSSLATEMLRDNRDYTAIPQLSEPRWTDAVVNALQDETVGSSSVRSSFSMVDEVRATLQAIEKIQSR